MLDLDASSYIPTPPPTQSQVMDDSEPEIFAVVEKRPELIGGSAKLTTDARNICDRLARLDGVSQVETSVTTGILLVHFDSARIDSDTILDALPFDPPAT